MKTMKTYDTHIENLPGSQHKRFQSPIFGREVLNGLNELSCITVAHLAGISTCHPFGENHEGFPLHGAWFCLGVRSEENNWNKNQGQCRSSSLKRIIVHLLYLKRCFFCSSLKMFFFFEILKGFSQLTLVLLYIAQKTKFLPIFPLVSILSAEKSKRLRTKHKRGHEEKGHNSWR